jgi:hypothetical protein
LPELLSIMQDFRFSRRWLWRIPSSGMWRRVDRCSHLLTLVPSRGFSTLKMEAIRSSQTSGHARSTRRHIPENGLFLSISLQQELCTNSENVLYPCFRETNSQSAIHVALCEGILCYHRRTGGRISGIDGDRASESGRCKSAFECVSGAQKGFEDTQCATKEARKFSIVFRHSS